MNTLRGVVAAMVTPMDDEGEINEGVVEQFIHFLIENRVHALFPLGTTGEMVHLSLEERKKFANAVVTATQRRVQVFIHTGTSSLKDTIELSKHACHIGADGIGVVTPYFMTLTDREMEDYYVKVARSLPSDFSVYLYNIPQCSANDLKPDTVRRIADKCSNVVGIKYSYPNIVRVLEYVSVNEGNFSVLSAPDSTLQASLALGCDGIVTGLANVFPELIRASYDCFISKDFTRAKRIQFLIYKAGAVLKDGSNMAYFKKALQIRGIDVGSVREPQLGLTAAETNELNVKMAELIDEMNML